MVGHVKWLTTRFKVPIQISRLKEHHMLKSIQQKQINPGKYLGFMFSIASVFVNVMLSWAQAPHKPQIAFVSDRDGVSQIYVMDVTGRNVRRLTTPPGSSNRPAWSPDGRTIAFNSDRDGIGRTGIYLMDADGGNVRKLPIPLFAPSGPTWSPDGRRIAFLARQGFEDENFDIYVIDVNGKKLQRLTNQPGADWSPTWSPDGKSIAFDSSRDIERGKGRDIYLIDINGRNLRNLTEKHPRHDDHPAWSSDGRKIAFVSNRDGNAEIYVMDADGRNQRNLTNHPASDGLFGVSWFDPRFALSVLPVSKCIVSWGWLKRLGQ
jgi:TolB protein